MQTRIIFALAAVARFPLAKLIAHTREGGTVHTLLYLAGVDVERLSVRAAAESREPAHSPHGLG